MYRDSRLGWTPKPPSSRRFTTLSAFRSPGEWANLEPNTQRFSVQRQFDPDGYEDERTTWTRPSKADAERADAERADAERADAERADTERADAESIYSRRESVYSSIPFDTKDPATIDEKNEPNVTVVERAEPPYHVFSKSERWTVVMMIGAAGLFSGLSSNIYFPALDKIQKDLNVSASAISLTITSYLIVQGISPLFWGSLSDTIGRRQIYIYSFLVYIVANIGLSFSPNFAVLLIFRGIQSAGSASTVSIGNGVIQDITEPAERGGFISFYQAIRNFSIAIGPVLGGVIASFFGFRAIFIFLLIISSITLLAIIILLPETLRSIAGNGALRLTGIHQPLIRRFTKEPAYIVERDEAYNPPKITAKVFIEPLKLLSEKDILISLIFGGTVYTLWSMVTASTTGLFKEIFKLNEILIGLSFIPNGLGTIAGSTIIGNLMNKSFSDAEAAYRTANSLPDTYKLPKKAMPADFPLEHARLKHIPILTTIFIVTVVLYGLSLSFSSLTSKTGWIVLPLILQFFIAASSNAVFAVNQTMVSDLCPGKGASSTAINNLVRCGMGAVGVAFIEQMIDGMGIAGAFLGLGFIMVIVAPLAAVQWYFGQGWRCERMERKAAAENKAAAA